MKPTKAQLADPKWWDDNAKPNERYYYHAKEESEYFSSKKLYSNLEGVTLLAKRPEQWVPEVGDCEVKLGKSWVKCKVDYICDQYIVVLMYGSNTYEALVRDHYGFRPIKTQREEFIERVVYETLNMCSEQLRERIANELYDAGCRFDLTEKDGN